MNSDYNEDKLVDLYYKLRMCGDNADWVRFGGQSKISIVSSYDTYNTVRGPEAIKQIKSALQQIKSHIPERSSSMDVYKAIMSGKYDSKLVICHDTTYVNNYIEASVVNGSLYMLGVYTSDKFDKKSPTEYIKKLDWVFNNFGTIFVKLPTLESE